MSVLFHITTRSDWDRASRSGAYAPPSISSDGFVRCATAEQHASVANALFPGRRDLVLLLIDGDGLTSHVRLEGADRRGRPFPHVYGPVELEAVFEVAPYLPGDDGRFRPHEEATGFPTFEATTVEEVGERAGSTMAGFPAPWWIAGGWALDLFLGRRTRPHADLEISILAPDQHALFEHLRGWDLRIATPAHTLETWKGDAIELPYHQVWARRGPGRPSSPDAFAADPTMLGFLLEQEREERWAFRRLATITRRLDEFGVVSSTGIPIVRPEVALLYKAKSPRYKDERDFDAVLPLLGDPERTWLASALDAANPDHPWRARL
jgi:uncharacterized protein (DUF952 family)